MEFIHSLIGQANTLLWGYVLIGLLLGLGLLLR